MEYKPQSSAIQTIFGHCCIFRVRLKLAFTEIQRKMTFHSSVELQSDETCLLLRVKILSARLIKNERKTDLKTIIPLECSK